MTHTCISFWEDIIRLQAYHPINLPDRHKYAAFIFKWISKSRPIKLKPNCKSLGRPEIYMHINAMFAFSCAFGFLNCQKPSSVEFDCIAYSGTFREIHPEQWALLFHFMEKANPNPQARPKACLENNPSTRVKLGIDPSINLWKKDDVDPVR